MSSPDAATEDIAILVHRLLAAYQEVLDLVARRSGLFWRLPLGHGPFPQLPLVRLRTLVPTFAASHAARSTRVLKRRLHRAAVDANDPDLYRREVALLDRFESSLPTVPTRTLLSLLAVGLLAVSYFTARTLGGSTDDMHPLAHLIGGVFLLSRSDVVGAFEEYRWRAGPIYFTALGLTISLWLLLALPITSFRLKRILFNACPDMDASVETLSRIDPRASSGGVYALERELFARLEARAPRELRFDLGLDAAIAGLSCIVGVYLALHLRSYPSGPGFVITNLAHPHDRQGFQLLGTFVLVLASLARLRQIRNFRRRPFAPASRSVPTAGAAPAAAAPLPSSTPNASWSRRAAASVLDGVFLYALLIPIGMVGAAVEATAGTTAYNATIGILAVALPFAYVAASHARAGAGYASPGKRALGLSVVEADGAKPSLRWTLVREIGLKLLLFSPAYVVTLPEYLRPLWRADGQTWHDRIAGTRVVRVEQERAPETALVAAPV